MGWLFAIIAIAVVCFVLAVRFIRIYIVNEGCVGLFYRSGRLVETLQTGQHIRVGWRLKMDLIDVRWRALELPGQDVLTRDNVTVKISLAGEVRVTDPAKAVRETAWWDQRVYSAMQIGLRNAVAKRTFDELLGDRAAVGDEVRGHAAAEVAELGVELKSVAVRDVMLTADLRRAFAEAVRLREEGKAALEKARAETAAIRSLANAARMLKDNPELLKVRVLQSIETIGTSTGNTLVLGVPSDLALLSGVEKGRTPAAQA